MSYIKSVKDTSNSSFYLHDPRLDSGEGINVKKDWSINDTQSSKYILNRTHYTDNRFELIYPEWDGYFDSNNAPITIALNNGQVLYKLTNNPFTTTITNSELEDIIVYCNTDNSLEIGTLEEIFSGETVEIQGTPQYLDTDTEKVLEVVYGTLTNNFTIYNVTDTKIVEIGNKNVKLTNGIYSIGYPDAIAIDTHPIKKQDEIHRLEEKYIPISVLTKITDLENKHNFTQLEINNNAVATENYVTNAISNVVSGDISTLLNNKMDKENPQGVGDFNLRKGTGFLNTANIITEGTVYVNSVNGNGLEVATKDWAMPATKTDFANLTINQVRVLTINDLPQITVPTFMGVFADYNYLYSVSAQNGDYAYVWDTYVQPGPNDPDVTATAKKYIYNEEWLLSTPTETITNTFTPTQWKNINEASNLINGLQDTISLLEDRVAELEEKCEAMFEPAEGQEF